MIDELVNNKDDWLYLPNKRCYLSIRDIHSVTMGNKIEHGEYKGYFNVDVSYSKNSGRQATTYYGKDASVIWEYVEDNKHQYKQSMIALKDMDTDHKTDLPDIETEGKALADALKSCGCSWKPEIVERCEPKEDNLIDIELAQDGKSIKIVLWL